VLRGPARDAVLRQARRFTSWPVTLLFDLPPLAFIGYSGYTIVMRYFVPPPLPPGFLAHTATVFLMLVVFELFLLGLTARGAAWRARRKAVRALHRAFASHRLAFADARRELESAREMVEELDDLRQSLTT